MRFEHLFYSGKIGTMELKNRIIFASHSTNYSEPSGDVSNTQVSYLARRAKAGVSLIISEICSTATET